MIALKKYGLVIVGESDDELARAIANENIDILVDMQGFMTNNFTNNLHLENLSNNLQHWLGYPGTLGLPCIDYLVADEIILPEKSQKYYREKIAYLPHCYQCNNPDFIQNGASEARLF